MQFILKGYGKIRVYLQKELLTKKTAQGRKRKDNWRESCNFLHGDDKADLTEAGLELQCLRNDTFLRSM